MRTIAVLPWLVALVLAQSGPTYTVQRGDTLYSIAKRHETTVEILMRLNGLSEATLSVGQVLQLPPRTVQHTVQRGDTLFSIARRYGSTVQAIQQENGLEGTSLSPGQVLRIPQVGAAAPTPQPPPGASASLANPTPLPNPTPPAPEPAPQPQPSPPADTDYDPTHPLILVVLKYLGLPYVFGASSDRAVDCSAFVQQVFAEVGIKLPRTSREQWEAFGTVQGAMRQGDLVFFSFGGRQIDHVGIYLGRGVFAHANSYGSRVVIESLDSPFYKRVYRGAKRVEALQAVHP
ncbi:C40 family peptidase [Meiothermus ruber]|jgi:cell wall-associated NlpC family hydrolase|uniref:NLP/P60 protein n=1 Tax=Meiothermus ruber (strain ATCC 35948 / DSM 1279 / VKM B-1258 / 21) TaxID=504728 RepID=D3PQD3_MEIRD|nr:C40 family peptidase [Meiothermus ruber]ADD29766.1 NLP/P60 protein [Meiothermus ruber DSM 1279]AGK04777.1 NLP/P60 protein [Meiothermus ruber DSM 1279]MCL6529533.1 LysM peptidoglycan-binding domain-containing protein [Meiothermus ruber]GIW39199.1 MAG: peptidoglycan-binding protein LysM [Meiothermus sp.]